MKEEPSAVKALLLKSVVRMKAIGEVVVGVAVTTVLVPLIVPVHDI